MASSSCRHEVDGTVFPRDGIDNSENGYADCVPVDELSLVLRGTSQFGIVYEVDSLATRIVQLLDRAPKGSQVRLHAGSQHHLLHDPGILRAVELCRNDGVAVFEGGESTTEELVVFFELPASSSDFLDRLRCKAPVLTYTLLQRNDSSLKSAMKVMGDIFKKAEEHATGCKVTELKCAVGQVTIQGNDCGVDAEDNGDQCTGSQGLEAAPSWPPYLLESDVEASLQQIDTDDSTKVLKRNYGRQLEVVWIDLSAVQEGADDNFKLLRDLAKPEHDHSYTILHLHAFGSHDHGEEHLRQYLPALESDRARVVFINAIEDKDGSPSWHDYLDAAMMDEKLGEESGSAWLDILDEQGASEHGTGMLETDTLIAQLVQLEIEWLRGQSMRVILSGTSQGGCMAFFRFLKSPVALGGFVGCVCHVPTAPHLPRSQDPLLQYPVNRDRPVRLLSGGRDTSFALSLVKRDLLRLKSIGGFTDVEHKVEDEAAHYMADYPDLDLKYLQQVLPQLLTA